MDLVMNRRNWMAKWCDRQIEKRKSSNNTKDTLHCVSCAEIRVTPSVNHRRAHAVRGIVVTPSWNDAHSQIWRVYLLLRRAFNILRSSGADCCCSQDFFYCQFAAMRHTLQLLEARLLNGLVELRCAIHFLRWQETIFVTRNWFRCCRAIHCHTDEL